MSDKKKKWGSSVSEQLQLKPADFEWENQELLDQKTNDWMNREKFSYDIGSDPMYQQYKEQYSALGKLAMEDTMGQASALTGGYANSYAQTVGQQAYQQYMDQLNAMVPELYSMARSNYDAEGQDLYNQIALLEGQRSQAFSEHQAELNDWYNYLNFLQQREASYRSGPSGDGNDDILDLLPDYAKKQLEGMTPGQRANYLSSLAAYGHIDASLIPSFLAIYNTGVNGVDISGVDKKIIEQALSYPNFTEADAYLTDIIKYSPDALTEDQAVEILAQGSWSDEKFHKAELVDDTTSDGTLVWRIGDKYVTRQPGESPYIPGAKNPDIQYGTFSNGYQPNNVNGSKLTKVPNETTKVNGVVQNVWKDKQGNEWYWDGTKNKYLRFEG